MDKLTGQFIADVFSQATMPETKKEFLSVLAIVLPNNPQIADAALTECLTKTAMTDPDSDVRQTAQQALGVIVKLADAALIASVKKRPIHPMAAKMSEAVKLQR